MNQINELLKDYLANTQAYYYYLIAGHLMLWGGVLAALKYFLFFNLMQEVSIWPVLFMVLGIAILLKAQRVDSE